MGKLLNAGTFGLSVSGKVKGENVCRTPKKLEKDKKPRRKLNKDMFLSHEERNRRERIKLEEEKAEKIRQMEEIIAGRELPVTEKDWIPTLKENKKKYDFLFGTSISGH